MTLKYARHAIRRMKERDITKNDVEIVMQNPDYIEPSVKERFNAFGFINGRYLRVTYKKEAYGILVITVTIRKKPFKRFGYEN